MKVFCFITLFMSCVSVYGHPKTQNLNDEQGQQSVCRRLQALIPRRTLNLPDYDISEKEVIAIEDAREIEDASITLDKNGLRGTFAFSNGVVEGGSTASVDFNYDPTDKSLNIFTSSKFLHISGFYEIIDGEVNLTTIGHHTFSGKGPLTVSVSGLEFNQDITFGVDVQTGFLSIANLKFSFNFRSTSIIAENLVVDGVPVEWESVNKNMPPIREKILEALHPYIQHFIQGEVANMIQGCTLEDLVQVVNRRNQENRQNYPQQQQ